MRVWLCLALCLLGLAQAAYVKRYGATAAGAISFAGNTLGLSGTAAGPGGGGTAGAFISTDLSLKAGGTWPAGTTNDWRKNSSTAPLRLPPGASVLYAELVWGGTAPAGVNLSTTAVTLTTPQGAVSVLPDSATSQATGSFYVRSANVTAGIQAAAPNGGTVTLTVGGVPGTLNTGTLDSAGWTLEVAYSLAGQPPRNLTLYVGAELTNSGGVGTPATVSGFCTPGSGAVRGRVAASAIEGDSGGTGDALYFGPSTTDPLFGPLSGANNKVGNFFASQINDDAASLDTGGSFGTSNQAVGSAQAGRQGWDITNVDASARLRNGQTAATVQGQTGGDTYVISALGIQIDVNAPTFPVTTKSADRGRADVGDVITYTVALNNTGNGAADNVTFKDPAPAGTSLVAGSVRLDGVAQPALDPAAGFGLGSIPAGSSRSVQFQVRVDSVPAGGPAQVSNSAGWTYDYVGCTGQPAIPGSLSSNTVVTPAPRVVPVKGVTPAGPVGPGDLLTYTVRVPNTGAAATAGATLADPLPAGTAYVTGSTTLNGAALPDLAGAMPFALAAPLRSPGGAAGAILPGEEAVVVYQVRVLGTAGASIDNTASLDRDGGGPVAAQPTSVTSPVRRTDLGLTKTGPALVAQGATLSYSLTVRNLGPLAADGAVLSDPAVADFNATGVSCAATGSATCPAGLTPASLAAGAVIPKLPAGERLTLTLTGTATGGRIVNTAAVAAPADVLDSDSSNNSAGAGTDTVRLALSKTVQNLSAGGAALTANHARPGDTLQYCLRFENLGSSGVTDLSLNDPLPPNTQPDLSGYGPGLGVQLTRAGGVRTYTSAADADAGRLDAGGLRLTVGATAGGEVGWACFRVTLR